MGGIAVAGSDARKAGALLLGSAALLAALPGGPGLPCPLRTLTGIPCPLCGMTTSVEATMRLQLPDAAAANPAGILLLVIAVVLVLRRPQQVRVPMAAMVGALCCMWVFELVRFGVL